MKSLFSAVFLFMTMTSSWADLDLCTMPYLNLIDFSLKETAASPLLLNLEKKKCLEIFNRGKLKKFGKYYEEGDRSLDLQLSYFLYAFLKTEATVRGSEVQPYFLPRMLAFGENHQAEKGNRKRGKILTLIWLQSCIEGRPVTLMSEALTPKKIAQFSSSLESKRNFLKGNLFMSLVDQMPDSFLEKLKLETWEENDSSRAKEELKLFAERIQEDVVKLMKLDREELVEGYRKAMFDLNMLEGTINNFVRRHAKF